VADRGELSIELYSTWNMHKSFLYKEARRITLELGTVWEWVRLLLTDRDALARGLIEVQVEH